MRKQFHRLQGPEVRLRPKRGEGGQGQKVKLPKAYKGRRPKDKKDKTTSRTIFKSKVVKMTLKMKATVRSEWS